MTDSGSESDGKTPARGRKFTHYLSLAGIAASIAGMQMSFGWNGAEFSLFLSLVFGLAALGARTGRSEDEA